MVEWREKDLLPITLVPCYFPAMKNVTITLDEKTAGWARAHAARRSMSLSRFIGEVLNQKMGEAREYERAMKRFLARKPVRLRNPGERFPTREEVNDRRSLR